MSKQKILMNKTVWNLTYRDMLLSLVFFLYHLVVRCSRPIVCRIFKRESLDQSSLFSISSKKKMIEERIYMDIRRREQTRIIMRKDSFVLFSDWSSFNTFSTEFNISYWFLFDREKSVRMNRSMSNYIRRTFVSLHLLFFLSLQRNNKCNNDEQTNERHVLWINDDWSMQKFLFSEII